MNDLNFYWTFVLLCTFVFVFSVAVSGLSKGYIYFYSPSALRYDLRSEYVHYWTNTYNSLPYVTSNGAADPNRN